MKKIIIAGAIVGALALSGCGQKVEVAPGQVGKIVTKDGYKEGVIPTSKFRLDPCMAYCDQIVTLDVSTQSVTESMKIFMPKDRLEMTLKLKVSLVPNPNKFEQLFNSVPPQESGDNKFIPWERAYVTFVQPTILTETREFLSQYTINEILSSREAVNTELSNRLRDKIQKTTPFSVQYLGLTDIDPPPSVVNAAKLSAERKEKVMAEEVQLEISQVTLAREFQEAQLQRKVDVEKAQAEKEINEILSKSMTPEYIRYRELQILEKLADSPNKTFVPAEMLSGLGGQVALGNSLAN